MKKIVPYLCLIMSLIFMGCATTTFKKTCYDTNGKVTSTTEVNMKRPILASTSAAWTDLTGNINSASSVDLQQILGSMLAGYLATHAVGVAPAVPSIPSGITGAK